MLSTSQHSSAWMVHIIKSPQQLITLEKILNYNSECWHEKFVNDSAWWRKNHARNLKVNEMSFPRGFMFKFERNLINVLPTSFERNLIFFSIFSPLLIDGKIMKEAKGEGITGSYFFRIRQRLYGNNLIIFFSLHKPLTFQPTHIVLKIMHHS